MLQSKWSGVFKLVLMTQHGEVELRKKGDRSIFLMNGQRVKHYFSKDVDRKVKEITLDEE